MKIQCKRLALVTSIAMAMSGCGSDSNTSEGVEVITNYPPVITSTALLTAMANEEYSYTVTATDEDSVDTLTMSAQTLPSWLNFDIATGVLSGTPTVENVGSHQVTIVVSDDTVETMQTFTLVVAAPANTLPVITSVGVTSATVGTAYSYTLVATDADNDALTMSASTLPDWLMFDPSSGVLSGTPAMEDEGSVEITLTVEDGSDAVTQTFSIAVTSAPRVPQLVVYEDAANSLWPAWDCCGGTTPAIVTDADAAFGSVTQFTIVGDTVVGFNARDAVDGVAFDTPNGTILEFDLKVNTMPSAGDTNWMLKLEGAGVAFEVNLNTSAEGLAPVLDTWMHYTFDLSDSGLSEVDLIMMFPAWGTGDGAIFSVDNVEFYNDAATTPEPEPEPEPEPQPAPSSALTIFSDVVDTNWSQWSDGDATAELVTDADVAYGATVEFGTAGQTVAGFSNREDLGGTGVTFDASSFASTGTLEFDLKMTAEPATTVWKLKVEGTGPVEVDLPQTPVLDVWTHYSFNLSTLGDLSAINNIMVFPNWADNAGAVYRIDNLKLLTTGNVSSNSGGSAIIDVATGIDFEGDESQQASWIAFENGDPSPALEFVSNPDPVGNTSATVAKLNLMASGSMWGGAIVDSVTPFALSASNAVVKIWVYKDRISPVGVKFENATQGSHGVRTATNTLINQWEELTIDFTADIGLPENGAITAIAVFPDNFPETESRESDATVYFDNITFGN